MKVKFSHDPTGVLTLQHGRVFNYGFKRFNQKTVTLFFYTEKALNELFKSNPSAEQRLFSSKILAGTEKELEKLGYLDQVKLSEVVSCT